MMEISVSQIHGLVEIDERFACISEKRFSTSCIINWNGILWLKGSLFFKT